MWDALENSALFRFSFVLVAGRHRGQHLAANAAAAGRGRGSSVSTGKAFGWRLAFESRWSRLPVMKMLQSTQQERH